jgi:hypothetical protein
MAEPSASEVLRADASRCRDLARRVCSPMAAQLYRTAARRYDSAAVEAVMAGHTELQAHNAEAAAVGGDGQR